MINAWEVATLVAIVAGIVGFFVVLRGSAFPAHAIPNGAFAGAAGAYLIGVSTLVGLGVFAVLALGAAFLSQTREYEPQILALLFGDLYGVEVLEILPIVILGAVCVVAIAALYRPLLLTSLAPEIAMARGIRPQLIDTAFLLVVACATTMTVPVVGALLIFALMIGPPAAARCLTRRPGVALGISVALALLAVWTSIGLSYQTNWPIGFFVGTVSAAMYVVARLYEAVAKAWPRRASREPAVRQDAGSALAIDASNRGR